MNSIPNTFGVIARALEVIDIHHVKDILSAYQKSQALHVPFLLMGEGSNTLFLEDFSGIVALNHLNHLEIKEQADHYLIEVGSGFLWRDLVATLLEQSIFGLENLALIPGTVGSAAIQNIGAYGVEFARFADSVTVLDLHSGELFEVKDGKYGYRDSIFKHRYQKGFVITRVTLKIPKQWQPILTYGELKALADEENLTAFSVYEKVIQARQAKLPDPKALGNAGSFFKNPVVDRDQADRLKIDYPELPIYPQSATQVKLAAGWLIDCCGFKGKKCGGASVHQDQALVIVNSENATGTDIETLAAQIQAEVKHQFGVELEPEVRFIDARGLID